MINFTTETLMYQGFLLLLTAHRVLFLLVPNFATFVPTFHQKTIFLTRIFLFLMSFDAHDFSKLLFFSVIFSDIYLWLWVWKPPFSLKSRNRMYWFRNKKGTSRNISETIRNTRMLSYRWLLFVCSFCSYFFQLNLNNI